MTRSEDPPTHPRRLPGVRLVLIALGAVGLCARLAPLLDQGGRLLKQFPTEDGYLTLTIARNMARGLGMSVSAGTIATNGTQPLVTWLWSLAFAVSDADRVAGVRLVLVLELAFAALTAWALYWVGKRLLRTLPHAKSAAAVAALAHFASPHSVQHSMNCLETGAYALAVLLVVGVWLAIGRAPGSWRWQGCIAMGLVLGLAFWVRNDAVFLAAALCACHWLAGALKDRAFAGRSLTEAILIGCTLVLVASPWLAHNLSFGHLVPISGIAESHHAQFGQNLHLVPTKLFEYLLVFAAVPQAVEGNAIVVATTTVALLVIATPTVRWLRHCDWRARPELWMIGVYATAVCAYYGLLFGAGHFTSRYLFPLSGFLALGFGLAATAVARAAANTARGRALSIAGATAIGVVAALQGAFLYARGDHHPHEQVVAWTQQNVDDAQWVGAIQTGTLGYFHDRTYNLDGKVSLEALAAKQRDEIPRYVVGKPIVFLVDWVGIATWLERPEIAEHFRLVVYRERDNLAVLERR